MLTCTGVSFAHGSNDGQKGMGLIMLILIGTVPTAYALNHAVSARDSQDFVAVSQQTSAVLARAVGGSGAAVPDARAGVTDFIRDRKVTPETVPALRQLVGDVGHDMARYKELRLVPAADTRNFRNDMYIIGEAFRLIDKEAHATIGPADWSVVNNYRKHIDNSTKFIPGWVKVAVAIALGSAP